MPNPSAPPPAWTVLVGPGRRLAHLAGALAALARPLARPGTEVAVERLDDVEGLLGIEAPSGRAIVDAGALAVEDVGFVRRFLERCPGWSVDLTGDDPRAGSAAPLAAHPRVRWLPWPLDVDQLQRALEVVPAFAAARTPPPGAGTSELEEIADILSAGDRAWSRREPREEYDDEDYEDEYGPESPDEPELPAFYRDQVADLADIAQRLHLSLEAAGDEAGAGGKLVERLRADVQRLLQFTRTLSYLVAPPAAGAQTIVLPTLLEELLATVAGVGPDAPRYLYRGGSDLVVRSDKTLLTQAFDAMLQLAGRCSTSHDVVRVSTRDSGPPSAPGEPPQVEVEISFPAGPLGDLEPEDIVVPYALRGLLPEIGSNALAAARGILRGQGGSLVLTSPHPGQLCWTARLPSSEGSGNGTGS